MFSDDDYDQYGKFKLIWGSLCLVAGIGFFVGFYYGLSLAIVLICGSAVFNCRKSVHRSQKSVENLRAFRIASELQKEANGEKSAELMVEKVSTGGPSSGNEQHPVLDLSLGDVCQFERSNGLWNFFRVLAIDSVPGHEQRIFSLEKFNVNREEKLLRTDIHDIEELMTFPGNGHFPVEEKYVADVLPEAIAHMPIESGDLEGYNIWKESFELGEAGVFGIPIENI